MKSAILKKYGGPETLIYYSNIQKPVITDPEQVLVRVTSVALSSLDVEVRNGEWEHLQDDDFQNQKRLVRIFSSFSFSVLDALSKKAATNPSSSSLLSAACSYPNRLARNRQKKKRKEKKKRKTNTDAES